MRKQQKQSERCSCGGRFKTSETSKLPGCGKKFILKATCRECKKEAPKPLQKCKKISE